MAKIAAAGKKPKKRRFDLLHFAGGIFFTSLCLSLFCTLFLRTYNNNLSTQKQSIDTQIASIQTQNDAVKVEIQTLSSSDRVDEIAADNNMSRNQSNVVTITDETQSGE